MNTTVQELDTATTEGLAVESATEAGDHAAPPVNAQFRERFAQGAVGILALRMGSMFLAMLSSILLARLLGAGGYGSYQDSFAWIAVIGVPAGLGLDKLVLRCVAEYRAQGNWTMFRGLVRSMRLGLLGMSLLIVLCALAVILSIDGFPAPEGFLVALLVLPIVSFLRLYQATLQGLGRVIWGQVPELVLVPLGLVGLLTLIYMQSGAGLGPRGAMACYVVASALALLAAVLILRPRLPDAVSRAGISYDFPTWTSAAGPLVLISGLQVINARSDLVMLGLFSHPDELGCYAAAQRSATLILAALLAANGALAPMIAGLHSQGKHRQLQEVITKSARLTFLAACPVAALMIFWANGVLGFFGADFVAGEPALRLLAIAQIATVSMGSVGLILMMTGHEREVVCGLGAAAFANVVLNALLIPPYGSEGAAIATGVSTLLWNAILAFFVLRKLDLHTTILGRWR